MRLEKIIRQIELNLAYDKGRNGIEGMAGVRFNVGNKEIHALVYGNEMILPNREVIVTDLNSGDILQNVSNFLENNILFYDEL